MKKKKGFIPYDYEAAINKSIRDLHEYFIEYLIKNRHKCIYALKEITSGKQFEVEMYPEFTRTEDIPEAGRKRDNSKAQKNLNDKNASKYLVRLIENNFSDQDLWITLTYENRYLPDDMGQAVRNMQNYIKRINRERAKRGLPKAKYIYVTEYSPEAEIRWHHHLIMDGMMDMDTVERIWKKGRRNQTRKIDKDENGLAGMAIYVTKAKDRRKGEKRWNSSTGLKKPKERKVHSKPPKKGKGSYKPIAKYIDGFVRDQSVLEEQLKKWYPDKLYSDHEIFYNDFNGMFYIRARMRIP